MLYRDYEGSRFLCSLLTTSKSRNMQGRFVTDISTKNAGSTDRVPVGAEEAIWVHVPNNSKIEKWATFVLAYIWEECSVEYFDPWGNFCGCTTNGYVSGFVLLLLRPLLAIRACLVTIIHPKGPRTQIMWS